MKLCIEKFLFFCYNQIGAQMKKNNIVKTKKEKWLFFKEISYAIIPFLIFVVVLLVSYFGNQLIYDLRGEPGSKYPEIALDSQVPLISWFVYFYYLTFPLGIVTFFYVAYKDKKSLYNIFLTLCISFAISGIIYLVGQTEFTKPDFTPVTFTDKLVVWTWGSTNPVNCFPSQHCFMAFAIIIAVCSSKGLNIFYRIGAFALSVMIILSTVFIRQHFILDIFASFDIMFIVFGLVYVSKFGTKMEKRYERKQLEKQMKKIMKNK